MGDRCAPPDPIRNIRYRLERNGDSLVINMQS